MKKVLFILMILFFSCDLVERYQVFFDVPSDTKIIGQVSQLVVSGEAAKAPIVSREGYEFVGWDKDFSSVTTNLIIKAIWVSSATSKPSDTTFTVSFIGGQGAIYKSGKITQEIAKGGSAIAPSFEKDGYKFLGWDKEFTNITSDLVVNARWEKKVVGNQDEVTVNNESSFIEACNNVKEGGVVNISDNMTLTSDLVLPKGVKLKSTNSDKVLNIRGSLTLGGDTEIDNISLALIVAGTLESDKLKRSIFANGYNLTIGPGVVSIPNKSQEDTNWPYLYAGDKDSTTQLDKNPIITLNGGNFEKVFGGGKSSGVKKATIIINGAAKVKSLSGGPEIGQTAEVDVTIDNNLSNKGVYTQNGFKIENNVSGNKKLTLKNMSGNSQFDIFLYSGVIADELVIENAYVLIGGLLSQIKNLYVESGTLQIKDNLIINNNFYGGGHLVFGYEINNGYDFETKFGSLNVENEVFSTTIVRHNSRRTYTQNNMIIAKIAEASSFNFIPESTTWWFEFKHTIVDSKHVYSVSGE